MAPDDSRRLRMAPEALMAAKAAGETIHKETRSGQEPESNHSPKQVKPYKWTQPDKNKWNGIQLNHI